MEKKNQKAGEKYKQLCFEDVVIKKLFNFFVILSKLMRIYSAQYWKYKLKYTAVDNDSFPIFAFSVSVHICLSL